MGSRPKEWMRKCIIWKYFADYFPMTLTKVEDLSTDHNYIIGSHPHGILSFGAFATFCTDGTRFSQLFPGLKSYLVTLNGQFWFPFRRDELMLTGRQFFFVSFL
uniref:diacylglycerol O-acyltransferase n=1 Tax=Ascaris lumbricoides TaxID=6252 RepID=A0A0M3IL26_ASCLU